MAAAAGVGSLKIRDLDPNTVNFFIFGVIIAKQDPQVISKRGFDGQTERAVWNFTLRDSPEDWINVTAWGSKEYIFGLSESFHVGDVVEVANPKLRRLTMGMSDLYNPLSTSIYQLTIVEAHTTINFHDGDDNGELKKLVHYVTKPPTDIFTLADVHNNGDRMKGEIVNLLVAIRRVGQSRKIKTKDGRDLTCREVIVFDQTHTGFSVQLWKQENIHRAENWKPRETILFLASVKLVYNDFLHGMSTSDGSQCIITENPLIPQGDTLRNYARSAPIQTSDLIDHLASNIPNPQNIRNVMSVKRMRDRASTMNSKYSVAEDSQFTCLIYCLITKLDLDGGQRLVINRCSECHTDVEDEHCANGDCSIGGGYLPNKTYKIFDIRVSLSDHTGSCHLCRLTGSAAERVLGCTAAQFMNMTIDQKTSLKWQFLLERCAVRVLVLCASFDRPHPLVSVLSCEVADSIEVATRIVMY